MRNINMKPVFRLPEEQVVYWQMERPDDVTAEEFAGIVSDYSDDTVLAIPISEREILVLDVQVLIQELSNIGHPNSSVMFGSRLAWVPAAAVLEKTDAMVC